MGKVATFLVVLLTIVLLAAGCGETETTPTPTPEPTPTLAPTPTPAPTPVATVSVDVHSHAEAGSQLTARINITDVTALDSYSFDVSYDPAVIDMRVAEGAPQGVTPGVVGVSRTPVDRWKFVVPDEGRRAIRVTGSVPRIGGVDGSGYLAEVNFRVVGSTGEETDIILSNVWLANASGGQIGPLEYAGAIVRVVGVGPTPTSTDMGQLPCRFYGAVQLDGADVPDGTEIAAVIEGDTYTTSTPSIYGSSTYALQIAPSAGVIYSDGTSITFVIDGYVADQLGNWVTGGNLSLDLSAST